MKIVKLPQEARYLTDEVAEMLSDLLCEVKESGCSELFIVLHKSNGEERVWCTTDGYSATMLGHITHAANNYDRAYGMACDDLEDWILEEE